MKLIGNWKTVALFSWSMRFTIAAMVFSAASAAWVYVQGHVDPKLFAGVTFALTVCAGVSRLIDQGLSVTPQQAAEIAHAKPGVPAQDEPATASDETRT